jgi:hypothetical protein
VAFDDGADRYSVDLLNQTVDYPIDVVIAGAIRPVLPTVKDGPNPVVPGDPNDVVDASGCGDAIGLNASKRSAAIA